MPIPSLFDSYIDETYQRLVQTTGSGAEFADGLGNPITFPTTSTGSLLATASAVGSTIIFEKGDGTTFPVTVAAGTGAPGGPFNSIQFNNQGLFDGRANLTFNSASNALTLTGSLNVSGSTTQVGNNTLLGNTTLSGSLIISGALGQPNPTISVFGDLNQKGYTRYLPVTNNIDTSISASYIYVSGSTNDLYFSQNGNGYSNTTRLRWLEGNLYTGLLNGGIITATVGSTTYQVSSGSGIIVNLNAGYNDNPYPTVQYLNWANLSASIAPLSASYDQSFIAINSSASITAQGTPYTDGEYNTLIPIGIVIHQNRSTINASQTFPSVGYGWKQRSFDFIKAFGPLKISGYALAQSGSSARGLVLSGGTAWVDGRNYTVDPNNPSYIVEATGITTSKIFRYYQSGSNWQSTWGYDTNAGAGYTTIDPTQYSNVGTLTPVSSNHWTIQRVFYFPNSATKAFYIYYGNAEYGNKADAIAAINTETFTEAPNTAANAIFVGYMILRNNADFTVAASYEFRQAGLFRGSGQGGAGGGGGATTLAALTDVSITSPSYGDLLMYDSTYWYNTKTLSGSYTLSGSLTTNDGVSVQTLTASFISASGGITGSLFGTASHAAHALSASYATTASYATYAANGGVTQLLAGPNITLSPTNGLGQVTITSTGGGGGSFNTATGSYGSFFSTETQNAGAINIPYSMSFNNTDISNGVSISGSTNSSIKLTNAGVYDLQFSAQLQKQGSGGGVANVLIWIRKNNIDLASTSTYVQLQGGTNSKTVAAWNWFLNAAAGDEYRIMWSADDTNAQIYYDPTPIVGPAVPSVIATVARVDQFLSNTGSFSGSFTGVLIGTASWAQNFVSASSYVLNSATSSFITNNQTGSFLTTSSFNNYTGSTTSQFAGTASYAETASFAPAYLPLTGGTINGNVILNGTASIAFLNVTYESASVIYSSGSNVFGDATNDTQTLIGTVLVSGSQQITGSLNAPNITGSLYGTASWAENFVSASSYVLNSATSSFVTNSQTGSFLITSSFNNYTGSTTSQFAGTASFASTASFVRTALTASYITSSNVFGPNGSNSILTSSFASTASFVRNAQTASYVNPLTQTVVINGGLTVTGSTALQGNLGTLLIANADTLVITGSLITTGSISLTGSMYVLNGTIFATSSYSLTASYIDGGFY